jgi:hypothetical protein
VTNNGDDVGTITYVVPQDAPDTLYYNCGLHSTMTGRIRIIPALTGVSGGPAVTSFRLVPNPARSMVSLDLSSDLRGGTIDVLDLGGRVVARFRSPTSTLLTWDGSGEAGRVLEPGVYLVRAATATGHGVTRRFIWLGR